MGAGRSVDGWGPVAEGAVSVVVVVVLFSQSVAWASDQKLLMVRYLSRPRLLNDSI